MKILINNGSGFTDYTRYVMEGTLQVEDAINVPTLLNMSLGNIDSVFVVPHLGSYVRVVSEKYIGMNALTYSQQIDQASAWGQSVGGVGLAPVITPNYALSPDRLQSADRLQLSLNGGTTTSDFSGITQTYTTVIGQNNIFSVWLKTNDGSTKVVNIESASGAPGAKAVTVTGQWQRFTSLVYNAAGTSSQAIIRLRGLATSATADLLVWGAQVDTNTGIASTYTQTGSAAILTQTPRVLATGFVTNEPIKSYLGLGQAAGVAMGFQMFEYKVQVTSDEWLLNCKSIPFIPTLVNASQGTILTTLAQTLFPSYPFDFSNVQAGDVIPEWVYDPQTSWSDLAKQFGDSSRYRYKVIDGKVWYVPFGDSGLGIAYDETGQTSSTTETFDPAQLITDILTVPPVNDAIVVGDTEPFEKHEDLFVGDGFTGDFKLRHAMFEGSSSLLINDDMTDTSWNTSYWTVKDQTGNFTLAGALNVISGPKLYGQDYIQATNGMELGGGLNLQHGEFLWNDKSVGLVGGIYTSSDFTQYMNMLLYSQDMTQGAWQQTVVGGVVVTGNNTTAPDSTNTGQKLAKGNTTAGAGLSQVFAVADGISNYVFTLYIKGGSSTSASFNFWNNTDHVLPAQTAVIISGPGSLTTSGGVPVINSLSGSLWTRVQVTLNAVPAAGKSLYIYLVPGGQTDVTSGHYNYFWGAMVEQNQPSSPHAYLATQGVAPLYVNNCLAGFDISSPGVVVPSISGASGIAMQGVVLGVLAGPQIISQQNHHYQLQTVFSGHRWDMYQRVYRTLLGTPYGGITLNANGAITFVITDIDLTAQTIANQTTITPQNDMVGVTVYRSTATVNIGAAFGLYVLVNNYNLNCTITNVTLAKQPQGQLMVKSLFGPTGGQLPVLPANLGNETGYLLGFGFANQTATIQQNGDCDTLSFYTDDIPGVGARIRLQSWEAAASVARVTDPSNYASQAVMPGDDGVRQAILTSLTPQPRTSEECEYAAAAAIKDRESTQYQGTYSFFDAFWTSYTDYPRPGRYFYCNAPVRNINALNMMTSTVRVTVTELHDEVMQWQVEFGPDNYLEKILAKFMQRTDNLLEPQDTSYPPDPVQLAQVGTAFAPDLNECATVSYNGANITIDVGATPATGIEIRRTDDGWGSNNQNLIGVFATRQITLPRLAFDQTWYIKQKNGSLYSRRPFVLRTYVPIIPAQVQGTADYTNPLMPIITLNTHNQDLRNVYGVEIRASDNVTVLYQQVYRSPADLQWTYNNTTSPQRTLTFYCYFFNLLWDYSPALTLNQTIATSLAAAANLGQVANYGKNCLSNPGFETNYGLFTSSAAFLDNVPYGTSVIDGWYTQDNVFSETHAGFFSVYWEQPGGSFPHGGVSDVLVRLNTNAVILSNSTYYGGGVMSDPVFVRNGDQLLLNAFLCVDGNATLPAGMTYQAYVAIVGYTAAGAYVSYGISTLAGNSPTRNVGYGSAVNVTYTVPSTVAYVKVYLTNRVFNNSGSTFNASGILYADARFDDIDLTLVSGLEYEVADGPSRGAVTGATTSYRPLSNPLSAVDAGSNSTLTISAFTMRVPGRGDLSLNSGTITALAYNTLYYIYYDDQYFAGGSPVGGYQYTTTKETALNGAYRYFVGSILTPLAGGVQTLGNNDGGGGAQNGVYVRFTPTTVRCVCTGIGDTGWSPIGTDLVLSKGWGAVTDGNLNTYVSLPLASSGNSTTYFGFTGLTTFWKSLKISVNSFVNGTTGTPGTALDYSLDGGATWTNVYLTRVTRAIQTDVITLSAIQNISLVQIRFTIPAAGGSPGVTVEDIWVDGLY